MKLGTFFVTTALLIVMGALTACPSAKQQETSSSQIQQGNLQMQKALSLEAELAGGYSIYFFQVIDPAGKRINPEVMAQDYNWRRLSKAERLLVKEKLATYIALIEQVLSLDAQKGLYVTNKELVLNKRDIALSFQKNLEVFEKIVGENFEPKANDESAPVFVKTQQV